MTPKWNKSLSELNPCQRMIFVAAVIGMLAQTTPSHAGGGLEMIKAKAENSIRREMIDPDSARFEWPFEFVATKNGGFYTCGRVNSKNQMGGYTGAMWFSVATKDGQIISLQHEETSPWIAGQCAKAARKGELRPAVQG